METFMVLVGIALLILPITIVAFLVAIVTRLGEIHDSMNKLTKEILANRKENTPPKKTAEPQPQKPATEIAAPKAPSPLPPPVPNPPATPPPPKPQVKEAACTIVKPPAPTPPPPVAEPPKKTTPPPAPPKPTKPREPSVLERRLAMLRNWCIYGKADGVAKGESAEKLLATTWLLRSGILVILFTSVFLLKLSIDKGVLSPTGRVALSYIAGAGLLLFGLSKRMRNLYWTLGQALCGISLGIFYFSSFAMTSMYHLVSPIVGGAVMCLTTLTAGFLADRLNSMSVALVALCGGYATPLLLNTGVKNFPGLFAYLMLLGIGVLWLAYRRNWLQLSWISMLFTYGIYALAFNTHYVPADFAVCQTALVLFFVLYSTTVFVHNVRKRIPATALEIFALLANSGIFFALSWLAIGSINHGDRLYFAPLTIGLAAYYLLHAIVLGRRGDEASKGLLLIFCALSGFYLALTFPVVLSGDWLAAAWALQAFTMLWLGVKLKSRLLKNCAWILYVVTLIHLAYHEFWLYSDIHSTGDGFWGDVIARIFQFLLPVASLAAAAKLTMKTETEPKTETAPAEPQRYPASVLSGILFGLAFLVLFLFLRFEIAVDLRNVAMAFSFTGIHLVWIGGCIAALLLWKRGIPGWWRIFFCVLLCGTILRILRDYSNNALWRWASPDFHWASCFGCIGSTAILTLGLFFCGRLLSDEKKDRWMSVVCRIAWPILLFVHTTREWGLIIRHKLPGLSGGGISVLWAIFAFVLVYRGISQSMKSLRYIGLGLFSIVVVKVFLFDMSHLDAMYRVIAFFVFGMLLLGAAFVYLKFWRGPSTPKDQLQKEEHT